MTVTGSVGGVSSAGVYRGAFQGIKWAQSYMASDDWCVGTELLIETLGDTDLSFWIESSGDDFDFISLDRSALLFLCWIWIALFVCLFVMISTTSRWTGRLCCLDCLLDCL